MVSIRGANHAIQLRDARTATRGGRITLEAFTHQHDDAAVRFQLPQPHRQLAQHGAHDLPPGGSDGSRCSDDVHRSEGRARRVVPSPSGERVHGAVEQGPVASEFDDRNTVERLDDDREIVGPQMLIDEFVDRCPGAIAGWSGVDMEFVEDEPEDAGTGWRAARSSSAWVRMSAAGPASFGSVLS